MTDNNEIKKVRVVESEQAKLFRQEWEEKFKMRKLDNRPPTAEEAAMHLKCREDHKKWLEQEQEKENKIIRTPLSKAVWDSNLILVQNLLKQQDIDINQSDSDGRTPIGAAISKAKGDDFEFVCLLVESGADINKKCNSDSHQTPIKVACQKQGNLKLVQYIVEHGADMKGALSAAAGSGDMAIVQVQYGSFYLSSSLSPRSLILSPFSVSKVFNRIGRSRHQW